MDWHLQFQLQFEKLSTAHNPPSTNPSNSSALNAAVALRIQHDHLGVSVSVLPSLPLLQLSLASRTRAARISEVAPEARCSNGSPSTNTTPYMVVRGGVYHYAYTFRHEGKRMEQPVMDWVGEMPILGKQFTYQLELDSARLPFPIKLLQVTNDPVL